jgi:hypothetical protein
VNDDLLEEPAPANIADDEPDVYRPWYIDHDAWHAYELHDQLGSGDN